MPRPYSEDLRWQAIWMKEILGFQVDEVAAAKINSNLPIPPFSLVAYDGFVRVDKISQLWC